MDMTEKEDYSQESIAKKYGIDIAKLITEQNKLAKLVSLKDCMDFSITERIAGCSNAFEGNKIISAMIICNRNFEVIEQNYHIEKINFPYISGFRAYREIPSMVECFRKLEETPDVTFIEGQGIAHPRKIGIASHFGIAIEGATIGITQNILEGEIKEEKIMIEGKQVGNSLVSKKGSRPIYISPGNMISLKTSLEITKKFLKEPHKLPEPIVLARKYADKLREEYKSTAMIKKENNSDILD
ncbi:MAG: endonuclease V [archaeon]